MKVWLGGTQGTLHFILCYDWCIVLLAVIASSLVLFHFQSSIWCLAASKNRGGATAKQINELTRELSVGCFEQT